jgi:hypothetical protein
MGQPRKLRPIADRPRALFFRPFSRAHVPIYVARALLRAASRLVATLWTVDILRNETALKRSRERSDLIRDLREFVQGRSSSPHAVFRAFR